MSNAHSERRSPMQYRKELLPFLTPRKGTRQPTPTPVSLSIQSNDNNGVAAVEEFQSLSPSFLVTADALRQQLPGACRAIVLVFRDGCGACEGFKGEFVKLVKLGKQSGRTRDPVKVWAVSALDRSNSDFLKDMDIVGVPTVFIVKPTSSGRRLGEQDVFSRLERYEGPRNANSIWEATLQ